MSRQNFKTKIKRLLLLIMLFFTPVILLFTTKIKLTEKERIGYFLTAFFKFTPIAFLINSAVNWHNNHENFLMGLYGVMIINAGIGFETHRRLKTIDLGDFCKSTLITIIVMFGVYFSLDRMSAAMPEGVIAVGFNSSVQILTLMFPIAKILRNSYILTNGKFPPEFLIKNLYNYEKDGNIKNFLNNDLNK